MAEGQGFELLIPTIKHFRPDHPPDQMESLLQMVENFPCLKDKTDK